MWLDLADEMGVLTVGSLAIECMNLPKNSPKLETWVENEVRESILRDRSRTCIVQWELFNELARPVLMKMLLPMTILARKLDPSRMILDESGGWAQGANLYLPYEDKPTKFNDIHSYPGQHVNENVYNKLILACGKSHKEMKAMGLAGRLPGKIVALGIMTYFSELGYGSLPDLAAMNKHFKKVGNPITPPYIYHKRLADQHKKAIKESGFNKIYPDLKKFCLDQQQIHGVANKRMIEAVRSNPLVIGYCIHALTAGDWIMGAGLLDLFRNPKTYAYKGTRAGNQPRTVSIRMRPRNVYSNRGTRIEITGINELAGILGILKVEISSRGNKKVFTKKIQVNMGHGISRLFKEKIDTKAFKGTYTIKAQITASKASKGKLVTENEYKFDVFTEKQLLVPDKPIAVLDLNNSLKPFLKKRGISFMNFKPGIERTLPVFVSRTMTRSKKQKELFNKLKSHIKAGGTAVYLQGPESPPPWALAGKPSKLLPVPARPKAAIGLWFCFSHIVKKHPIFKGLPVDQAMGPVYENVWAHTSMLDVGVKPIAGSVGFDFAPDFEVKRRHYYGPGETWWGTDVGDVPFEKGRFVVSYLRLVENLGIDPVADLILYNMIRFVT